MSSKGNVEPSTLQEAINMIKFLNTSHKEEISKWKDAYQKQTLVIKRLELNRKKELEFLSNELRNYELTLASKSEYVAEQLALKDDLIEKQLVEIEALNKKLQSQSPQLSLPEINVLSIDSNSDSGIALEIDETDVKSQSDTNTKCDSKQRKCGRRFAESISFLRKVDFTPRRYKTIRDNLSKHEENSQTKKCLLEVPTSKSNIGKGLSSNDKSFSDDDRTIFYESLTSKGSIENLLIRTKPMNDSMNNHFSDDGSEDTSEEIFDRVMTRSSVRRSVKSNPKYKKINRTKSKLLEQVKNNILD